MKISTTKYKSIEILPFLGIFLLAVLLGACRDENIVVYPTAHETGDQNDSEYAGMYVLNEGNMGSNKCTLDYLDLSTGTYTRNIYPSRNPNQVMELGDVGNDIKIYGSSLWMVVNMSNKVEVAHAATAVSRGHVDIPNCRNIAFANGYAYVSSYVGKVNGESVLGGVYKVDTTTLQVVGKVTVGYQPDELAVVGGKLYVANSGGYQAVQGRLRAATTRASPRVSTSSSTTQRVRWQRPTPLTSPSAGCTSKATPSTTTVPISTPPANKSNLSASSTSGRRKSSTANPCKSQPTIPSAHPTASSSTPSVTTST